MKTHAIIPVFISHRGCPNDCVFCNQKKITARKGDVTPKDAEKIIDEWLTTLDNIETVEISFYGGSFTGLPIDEQTEFLKVAKRYKDDGLVDFIRLSTRPDYISPEILENLKAYSVDIIELGVQSFDENVLKLSGRGHNASVVYEASKLIKDFGFTLGIQLMIGLPGDSLESCIFSAKETVKLAPSVARLYPTVTIKDTELFNMYERGDYKPLDNETAVSRTKAMYEILDDAGIKIIRVGLKSSEIMESELGFHPAFRQLVEGEIAKERIEKAIDEAIVCAVLENPGIPKRELKLVVSANEHCYGNIFGHKGVNRTYFDEKYQGLNLAFSVDESLKDNEYKVLNLEGYTMGFDDIVKTMK